MRLKIAIVLAVLGLLVLGTGIGQRTIWLPPATLTASAPAGVTPAPLTVVGPELLNTRDGKFTMTVKSEGPIQLAVARERDINGWIGDAAYTMVGGANDDFTALSSESKTGAEKVPNPAGSDMWVSEEKGTGELTYTWQSPGHGDWALLLSSDGTAPAPTDISITVDNESGTPWAVPLMVIGSALLALAALLFLLAPRKPKAAEAAPGRRAAGRAPSDPATGALEGDKIATASGTAAAAAGAEGSAENKSTAKSTDTSDGATVAGSAAAATKPAAAGDATATLPASLRGDTVKSDSVKTVPSLGTEPGAKPAAESGATPAAALGGAKQDADRAAKASPGAATTPEATTPEAKVTGKPVAETAAGAKGAADPNSDKDAPSAADGTTAGTDASTKTGAADAAAKTSGGNTAEKDGSFMKNVFKRAGAKKPAEKDPKSGPDNDSGSKGDSGSDSGTGTGGGSSATTPAPGTKGLPADDAGQHDGTKKQDGKSEFSVSRTFGRPAAAAPKSTVKKGLQMKARWGAALAVVLVAGGVGPAVADDASTPAPAPSATAEAPATPDASSTPKAAATEGSDTPGFPNLLDSQVQRITESVATVVASGDNGKDAKVLESRVAGTALQVRTANYKIRAAAEKQAAAEPVNATKLLAKVVTTTETWPRSAMFVTQGENNALPQLLTLVQASPRENYKLTSATPLLPGQTFPTVDKEGTKEVALDSADGLKMSPEAAISALSDRLTKEDSKFKDSFNDSVYITSVFDLQKKVAADAKDADMVFSHKGNKDTAVSMRTADGGAMVVVGNTFGIDATSKADATLTVGEDAAVFTGGKETTKGFNLNYAEPVVMYIPPASGDGKITLVSATRSLVGASFK